MTFATVSSRASYVPRARSSQFATASSTSSSSSHRISRNTNIHRPFKSLSRKIQHRHDCSLHAKKKTYESSEEAAEHLLFYNEEDLVEDDEDVEELLQARKLSADKELIIDDRELAMLGLAAGGEEDDFDEDDEDGDIDGLFIEGEDGDSLDIASFLKKNGKIDSENDFDFEEDMNFDVSGNDEAYYSDGEEEEGEEDDDDDDFVFIPKGSGIEFKSEDLYNIDLPNQQDFGFLSEYVKKKPGYEDANRDGDPTGGKLTINTATRSPRKSRSKNDVFIRDTSKDKAPKTSEFDAQSDEEDYLAFGADDETKTKKRLDLEVKNATLVQMGVPKALLEQVQREQELLDAVNDKKKKNLDSFGEERKTHKRLQIVAGRHSRRVILTPSGLNTRPMMGVVRGATFDMILSFVGSRSNVQFPENARWLDLFAGTGAIGLEALSRGCVDAHFVEMDDWTVKNVTRANIKTLGEENNATAHCASVETFLQRHSKNASGVGGAFNFVSFCPPYEKVSYPDLLLTLDASPLLSDDAIVLVEYAIGQRYEIKTSIGKRLRRVRNRRYGRTFVALYVCDGREVDEDNVEEPKLHGKAMN